MKGMTKTELTKKIDTCFENAVKMLEDQGSLIPMLDLEFKDSTGKNSIIAIVLADETKEMRDKFIKGLGSLFGGIQLTGKIQEVSCISMMSEAWFSTPSKEEVKQDSYKIPSQDPKRRECLIATGLTPDGTCIMRTKEMFSVEIKGKRHFSLRDLPEMKGNNPEKTESNLLGQFFDGYKYTLSRTIPKEYSAESELMRAVPLEKLIEKGIEFLIKEVGQGKLKSEFINVNK